MDPEALRQSVADADPEIRAEALLLLLGAHASPVFGAATTMIAARNDSHHLTATEFRGIASTLLNIRET